MLRFLNGKITAHARGNQYKCGLDVCSNVFHLSHINISKNGLAGGSFQTKLHDLVFFLDCTGMALIAVKFHGCYD